jgi:succinate dehydrogenase / fumarate reductase cytochrome b subunit
MRRSDPSSRRLSVSLLPPRSAAIHQRCESNTVARVKLRSTKSSRYNPLIPEPAANMPSHLRRVLSSSVGTKLLVGLTGLLLFAYLITHLAGNAIIFFGPEAFNEYAHALMSNPLIIVAEIGLLLIFLLHIYKAGVMWIGNQAARPVSYAKKEWAGHTSRKSVASSTMIFSGLLIALFVMVHVKQFKYGSYYLVEGSEAVRDLYRTEIEVFSQPAWVVFYVVCTVLVGLHLRHGIASGFQSLGLDHPRYTRRLVFWGILAAIVIAGGLASIPVWVYLVK